MHPLSSLFGGTHTHTHTDTPSPSPSPLSPLHSPVLLGQRRASSSNLIPFSMLIFAAWILNMWLRPCGKKANPLAGNLRQRKPREFRCTWEIYFHKHFLSTTNTPAHKNNFADKTIYLQLPQCGNLTWMYVIKSTSVFSWEEQEREGRRRREETHLTLTERERELTKGGGWHTLVVARREREGGLGNKVTDTLTPLIALVLPEKHYHYPSAKRCEREKISFTIFAGWEIFCGKGN